MSRFISIICGFVLIYCVSSNNVYFENYYEEIDADDDNPNSRNAIRWDVQKWPNKTIPYCFTDDYTPAQRDTVDSALAYFNENTCVRFERRNNIGKQDSSGQRIVLFSTNGNRCGTRVGYQPFSSTTHNVYMTPLCLSIPGAIQHEMMHVIGIFHEQCRSDRNQYIDIDWTNIDIKYYHNFIKVPIEYAKPYDSPYDYGSIMHYSEYAFAKDPRKPSIYVRNGKENPYGELGQLRKPSAGDLNKIRRMYRCTDRKV